MGPPIIDSTLIYRPPARNPYRNYLIIGYDVDYFSDNPNNEVVLTTKSDLYPEEKYEYFDVEFPKGSNIKILFGVYPQL